MIDVAVSFHPLSLSKKSKLSRTTERTAQWVRVREREIKMFQAARMGPRYCLCLLISDSAAEED